MNKLPDCLFGIFDAENCEKNDWVYLTRNGTDTRHAPIVTQTQDLMLPVTAILILLSICYMILSYILSCLKKETAQLQQPVENGQMNRQYEGHLC